MQNLCVKQPNHHFRNRKWKELTGGFEKFSTAIDIHYCVYLVDAFLPPYYKISVPV
jgi:hypothetical protein